MSSITDTFIYPWGIGDIVEALFIGQAIDQYVTSAKATLILHMMLGIRFAFEGYVPKVLAGVDCFIWGCMVGPAPQQHALVSYSPKHATASVAWHSSANYLGTAVAVLARH